jgi:hypothetical protein
MILKRVEGLPVTFGGEIHKGWLPPNAAMPLPTPIEYEVLDVTIQTESGGYLLIWTARPSETCRESLPPKAGDTWYKSVEDSEAAAQEWFGIEKNDWLELSER